MIFRGALGLGLVWLCMTQGPDVGLAPARACETCQNPLGDAGAAWRDKLMPRLQAMKIELGGGQSGTARYLTDRLAAGKNP